MAKFIALWSRGLKNWHPCDCIVPDNLTHQLQSGIVFGIMSAPSQRKKQSKYSMFLTLVYHRCKFSIPISKCSTHKFSNKINWVHIKMHSKVGVIVGVIVFDIQCFNWDQAAELQRSVLTAPWFPSVKGDSWVISWGTLDFLSEENQTE